MSGTRAGGLKAYNTCKRLYGEDFYKVQGQKGGSVKVPKGFSMNPELAREAGRKGGKISRKPSKKPKYIDIPF